MRRLLFKRSIIDKTTDELVLFSLQVHFLHLVLVVLLF